MPLYQTTVAAVLSAPTGRWTTPRFDPGSARTANGTIRTARVILEGVRANKRRVLIGADAHVIDAAQRSFPTLYQKALSVASKFGAKA